MAGLSLQKASPSENLTIGSLLVIVVCIIVSITFILPARHIDQINLVKSQSTQKGQGTDLVNLQKAQIDLNTNISAMANRGTNLAEISSSIPDTEDVPSLYLQLQSISTQAATTLSDVHYTVGTPIASPTGGSAQVPITFYATGNYSDLKNLLPLLENNVRPIILTDVALAPTTHIAGTSSGSEAKYIATMLGYVSSLGLSSAYTTPISPTQ